MIRLGSLAGPEPEPRLVADAHRVLELVHRDPMPDPTVGVCEVLQGDPFAFERGDLVGVRARKPQERKYVAQRNGCLSRS